MSDSYTHDMKTLCEEFEKERGCAPAEILVDQQHQDEWEAAAHVHLKAELVTRTVKNGNGEDEYVSEYAYFFITDDREVLDHVHRFPRVYRFVDSKQQTHELSIHYGYDNFVASWWQVVVSKFLVDQEYEKFYETTVRQLKIIDE